MSEWYYQDKIVTDNDIPPGAICFVYRITRKSDGKFYFGKKMLFFSKTSMKTVTLKSGIKRKKKIKSLVPSDWKTYWSSSPTLIADVKLFGEEAFSREILLYFGNKGSASYYELRNQMDARVLERNDCYNSIVNIRCHKKHVKSPIVP